MTESTYHRNLKDKAKELLNQMGMTSIKEEYKIKRDDCGGAHHYIIDVVGFNDEKSIAIECGFCCDKKLEYLQKTFTEVMVLPHQRKTSLRFSFRLDRELVDRINVLIKRHYVDTREEFVKRALIEYLNRIEKPIRA